MDAVIAIGSLIAAASLGIWLAVQNCRDSERVLRALQERRAWRKKHRNYQVNRKVD